MHNGINREKHELLDNRNNGKLIAVLLNHLNGNKYYNYNQDLLPWLGLDGFLKLSITNENIHVSEDLKECLDEILEQIPPKKLIDAWDPLLLTLIETVKQDREHYS